MEDQDQEQFFGENRSLFSDYFLRERLSDRKEWKQDISEPFKKATSIYQANRAALPQMNEAQTEKEFIQPVMEKVLGFRFDVQKTEKHLGRINIPDYILFPDEPALKKAQENREDPSYYTDALALSDAKYWERPLDSKGVAEKDRWTNANPSFQIVNYLTVTGLDWGILTNGSRWRLYSTKARSRVDSYFEVDLKRILEEEDEEQFRYFYHFFSRASFLRDPGTGLSFLESVFEGSIDYGSRLEKRLKDLIFEDIFLLLGRGFVEYRKEEEGVDDETGKSLGEIYQGTLRLLYRLLFLLHAESRGLLPLDNSGYRQYSLMELKKDIAERTDKGLTQSSRSFDVWNDLDSLFRIIDKGDPDLNVPRYNGGLFRQNHPNNRFLAEHRMADKYLVPALELLTREPDPETGEKRFIDYKSLNVEQLGSIYEGLLEFHLCIAGEPLAVVKEKGREVYKPASKVKNPVKVLDPGELYLENDKGERKATGSYYTPHYIVEYIVEHTLGPVFEERAETFRELMEQLEPKYEAFGELDAKIRAGDKGERSHNKRKELHLEIEVLENRASEALLSIRVCDPAMGSGHFLKEATDKLAEKIITLLAEFPENPVSRLLEKIRSQILESLREQHIDIDAEEHLKDTNLVKRMVMKRCIYGVDLNPMAVELAKLSLWLDSFTVGAPLSFLDHHLKCGNSLIGSTVKEVKRTLEIDEDAQIDIFGGPFAGLLTATELMRNVAFKTDATFGEIEESIEYYSEYEKAVQPYKKLLDLWISRLFGNEKALVLLRQYPGQVTDKLRGRKSGLDKRYDEVFEQSEDITKEKHFFHWELEFPEVFVDLKKTDWLENPGFDVVVGNPPYVRIQELNETNPEDISYLKDTFRSAYGSYDIYLLFVERGYDLLQTKGIFGYILPNKFFQLEFGLGIRKLLSENKCVREIIDLDSNQVFKGQTTYTCLLFLQGNGSNYLEYVKLPISNNVERDLPNWLFDDLPRPKAKLNIENFSEAPWLLVSGDEKGLIEKLSANSQPFKQFVKQIFQGLISGADKIYSVEKISDKGNNVNVFSKSLEQEVLLEWDLLKPLVSGKEVNRYRALETDQLLIFPYELTEDGANLITCDKFEEQYPLTWKYLKLHEDKLRGRESGKLDNDEWYQFSRTQNLDKHEDMKLCTARLVDHLSFAEDYKGAFYLDNVDVNGILLDKSSKYAPTYLLSLLNSSLLDWRFKKSSVPFRGGFFSANKQFIANLPILEINFSKFNPSKNEHFPDKLNGLYESFLANEEAQEDLIELVEGIIQDEEEYRLPVIHDFLASLAERMLDYNKQKQKLEAALDPFKFLNKGTAFKPFNAVFSDAIKYAERFTDGADPGAVHHDIEALRLEPEHEHTSDDPESSDESERRPWRLIVHLKHRDPETGWSGWEKDGEGNIVRSAHPVYRFELSDAEARYWQQAFEVLEAFEHSSTFPGGKTRTTQEKLMATSVPVFDDKANIQPLIELREELAEVEAKIEKTDWLIDQVVYRLYGLSEEEIKIVEEGQE